MSEHSHPHLDSLTQRHRSLDDEIAALQGAPGSSEEEIKAKKIEKLRVKEEITRFQGKLH